MTIKELILELQQFERQDAKVIITTGNEDYDTLSTSEFEICNKDGIYNYVEFFINEDSCSEQI